jgi:hypothetical protein
MRLLISLDGVEDYSGLVARLGYLGRSMVDHCGEVRAIDISGISLAQMGELTLTLLEFDCYIVSLES